MLLGNFSPPTIVAFLVTLAISFTFHEFAHAWTAVELGDDTPRLNGRLSLNPLAHLDPIGSLLLLFAGFGWAKPVPINPYNFRNTRLGLVLVSAAGPFANLILALVAAIPYRMGMLDVLYRLPGGNALAQGTAMFIEIFIILNLNLMLFNLIPIGPLDGAKILQGLAPANWDRWLVPLQQYGTFILMALVFLGSFGRFSILGAIISPVNQFLTSAILGL